MFTPYPWNPWICLVHEEWGFPAAHGIMFAYQLTFERLPWIIWLCPNKEEDGQKRIVCFEKNSATIAGLKDVEEVMSQGVLTDSRSQTDKKTDTHLEPSEGTEALMTLILVQCNSCQTSNL